MAANVVSLSLALLVALAAGIAIYYWRRASSLYQLLMEGAGRFEDLRQRSTQLEQALGKAEERIKQNRDVTQRLEKGIDDAREKTAELTRQLEAKEQEKALSIEKLTLVQNHLEKQLDKAEKRLAISETEREEASSALAALRREYDQTRERLARLENDGERSFQARLRQELEVMRQEVQLRERELTVKLREAEREQTKTNRKLEEADPVEMRRVKRKIAQYERLYQSMKGLREMTDERNRNWEVALRKLSTWVLTKNRLPAHSTSIGAAVGQALAAIGEQLIDDSDFKTLGAHSDIDDFGEAMGDGSPRGKASSEHTVHGGSASSDQGLAGFDAALNDRELAAEQAALDREVESLLQTPPELMVAPGKTPRSSLSGAGTKQTADSDQNQSRVPVDLSSPPRAEHEHSRD